MMSEYDANNNEERIKELEDGIRKTLDENRHLTDGENCTLATLKSLIDWS